MTLAPAGKRLGHSVRHTRIIVTYYGGPDALQVIKAECPEPKRGEVRVKVLAAGVALPDLMAREGFHPETPHVPFTPGWDLIGVVDRLGDGVSGIESGQIRFREAAILGVQVVRSWLLPGRKRMVPYSIQTLKRLRPAW